MGGYGSGRWGWHTKKTTVEDCRHIDAVRWQREGILRIGTHQCGSWHWRDPQTGADRASIGYEVRAVKFFGACLRLFYTWDKQAQSLNYHVRLVATRPNFGGLRWWFVCPLVVNGRACGRRVRKLYLAPGCSYFGCRHCLNLTYTSAQEHDKRVDFLRRHPEMLAALLRGGVRKAGIAQLGLALRAMDWP